MGEEEEESLQEPLLHSMCEGIDEVARFALCELVQLCRGGLCKTLLINAHLLQEVSAKLGQEVDGALLGCHTHQETKDCHPHSSISMDTTG